MDIITETIVSNGKTMTIKYSAGIRKPKFTGCKISLDGESWYCHGFRTRIENLRGAWTKLRMDYGNEYLPESKEDFYSRGGNVEWYRIS